MGDLTLREKFDNWLLAWDRYDLEGVLSLCHDDILFEHWTGARVQGKKQLRRAWAGWFDKPDGFRFFPDSVWFSADGSTIVFHWTLAWPSRENAYAGAPEKRRGVDILKFEEDLILEKLTYCKTILEINEKPVPLRASK